MPVLHCYADYKWTGPSEPVVELCGELSRRGWRSDLAHVAAPPGWESPLAERARAAGLRTFEVFSPYARLRWARFFRDRKCLAQTVGHSNYCIVHCHGTWDHVVAGWSRGLLDSADIPVIRSDHAGRDYRVSPMWRYHYGPRMINHLIVLSDRYAVQAAWRMLLDPRTVTTVRGAVDTEAFRPEDPPPDMRERSGLKPDNVIVGLVARIQRHRRFDILLHAAAIVRDRDPRVKIAICGRGTQKEKILDRPVQRMGLQDTVFALGYRHDDYRQTIAMFDAGLMLVPGSDGSCRAALQVAAMGKPLIVARRGVLPDIVRDGETGIVVDDTPENLARAILEMAADADRRRRWGEAARRRMCEYFTLGRQAEEVIAVYQRLLRLPADLREEGGDA